jgi:hypothetical protein
MSKPKRKPPAAGEPRSPQRAAQDGRRRLAEKLCPDPGPMPRDKAAFEVWEWANFAHGAAFGADPETARLLAEEAYAQLASERPLPAPVRRWLQFVLNALLLSGEIPRAHFGRPSDPRASFRLWARLGRRLIARRRQLPRESLDMALAHVGDEIAAETGESVWKIYRIFALRDFRKYVNTLASIEQVDRLR